MSQMKAVRIHSYGGRDVLNYEDAPRPEPGAGEVLLRVHATSVNPLDTAIRSGYMTSYFNHTLPLILGTDIAGLVEQVGPGVETFKPGDHVFGRGGIIRDGAYAEYIVVPATDVAYKPHSLDDSQAAALPHVFLTAWQALYELADLREGQTVLIHGAAGGVGHIAVQLARLRGAGVVGTASQNLPFLDELEVDHAIDYSGTAFEDEVSSVDAVLDMIGGDTQERSWELLKPNGILVSTVEPPSEELAAAHGARGAMVFSAPPIGETLTKLAALVDSGKVAPHVSAVLPLKEVARAHEMIESRHTRGKIVLQVSP